MGEMSQRRGRKGPRVLRGRRDTAPGPAGGEGREPGFAAVDDYVRAQMKAARIPGLALAIVQDGRAVHLQGFGRADNGRRPFTPQTPFFIGSNSKSFTALAVMQLAEAGVVELDAPVQRYIPWFRVADPHASGQITIRHLLNQTSGLSEAAGNLGALAAGTQPLEAAVRALATVQPARPVGAAFEYSNLNYTILGLVVETASGEPFDRYLQAHIFGPLQMRHTHTTVEDAKRDGLARGYRYWFGFPAAFDAPALGTLADGGIISTAEDMSHYLAMYQNGGRYHGTAVLSAAGIAQMLHPGPRQAKGMFAGAGYGMGWYTGPWGGVEASYHFGDWTHAHCGMALVPDGNWGVGVLFNVGLHGGVLAGLLAIEQSLAGMLAGGTVKDTGVGTFYLAFDAAVAAILAAEGWSLARLARRAGEPQLPLRGFSHALTQGRRCALPLLWEFGIPAAIAVLPARFKVGWKGMFLYGPDVSCALAAIGGLAALTGLLRTAKAGRALRGKTLPVRASKVGQRTLANRSTRSARTRRTFPSEGAAT